MTNDFSPFLINDRSSSFLNMIDACQFTESELNDVYDGVFMRMKESFAPDNTDKPLTPPDVRAVREYVATLNSPPISQDTADWMQERRPTQEEVNKSLNGLIGDLDTDEKLLFQLEPLEAYMILGMVQAAIVSLGLPENLEKFGRKFIGAFCDRYRIIYPAVVGTLELGWRTLLSEREFDELMDSDDEDFSLEELMDADIATHSPNPIIEIWEDKFIA